MLKRALCVTLAAAVLTGLCGCASILNREYLSVSDYTEEDNWEFLGDAVEISNYVGLKRAINEMVTAHKTEEKLIFTNYDGTIRSDLDHACWEVRDDTALGSYCVDYMSHDLTRILTYYQATVYINYKRTAADVGSIIDVHGSDQLQQCLYNALLETDTNVVIRLNDRDLTEDSIRLKIEQAFGANPMSCIEEPESEITIHPNSGLSRIVEINLEYPLSISAMTDMRSVLLEKISSIVSHLPSGKGASAASELYNRLAASCQYDPDGEIRSEHSELNPEGGRTLYSALSDGIADSRGIALAYSALCREVGLNCMVVSGTMDKQEHWWNIIEIDGEHYHVDVSADSTLGITGAFLISDTQMRVHYWWNIEDYPECVSSMNLGPLNAVQF